MPKEIEAIKQEFITSEHDYTNFGSFLVKKYNFQPQQVRKGEFVKIFGSTFKEINDLRRLFLIRRIGKEVIRGEFEEIREGIEILKEKKDDPEEEGREEAKRQLQTTDVNKGHRLKAKKSKDSLLNAIYALAKKLEKEIKNKKGIRQIEMFFIQNARNVKEILEILIAIEKEGDLYNKLDKVSIMPKFILSKNEITTQSINFQTVKPEQLVTFNNETLDANSAKEPEK